MADFTITIRLVDNAHAVPAPGNIHVYSGDTITYVPDPPGRAFRVSFESDPFSDRPPFEITDSEPHTIKHNGRFFCKCFIVNNDGNEVGWFPAETPESGGDHDVRP